MVRTGTVCRQIHDLSFRPRSEKISLSPQLIDVSATVPLVTIRTHCDDTATLFFATITIFIRFSLTRFLDRSYSYFVEIGTIRFAIIVIFIIDFFFVASNYKRILRSKKAKCKTFEFD